MMTFSSNNGFETNSLISSEVNFFIPSFSKTLCHFFPSNHNQFMFRQQLVEHVMPVEAGRLIKVVHFACGGFLWFVQGREMVPLFIPGFRFVILLPRIYTDMHGFCLKTKNKLPFVFKPIRVHLRLSAAKFNSCIVSGLSHTCL